MLDARECLGTYSADKVLNSILVGRKLDIWDGINSRIGKLAFNHVLSPYDRLQVLNLMLDLMDAAIDPTLSIQARMQELEVLRDTVEHSVTVLRKSRKRKKAHSLRLDP